MASSICMIKNIDADQITFDPVRKNALGGNVVYLKHKDAPRLQIQTPAVAAPFGMSTFTDEKTGAVKYSLDISFRGMESELPHLSFTDIPLLAHYGYITVTPQYETCIILPS